MIEVGVREFVRNWKQYMDTSCIITKRGVTLGRWIPIVEEDGKQIAKISGDKPITIDVGANKVFDGSTEEAIETRGLCKICDGNPPEYSTWYEGEEVKICTPCIRKKFPSDRLFRAAVTEMEKL